MYPCHMTKSHINQAADLWTCQALSASRYLIRLYRALDDPQQATTANLAMGTCEERAERRNIRAQAEALRNLFVGATTSETVDEERAWTLLVESQAGLWAFLGLIEDPEQARSIRGLRTSTIKALHQALKGIRVAFPEDMATTATKRAILAATDRCVDAFVCDLQNYSKEAIEGLRVDLRASTLATLFKETGIAITPTTTSHP